MSIRGVDLSPAGSNCTPRLQMPWLGSGFTLLPPGFLPGQGQAPSFFGFLRTYCVVGVGERRIESGGEEMRRIQVQFGSKHPQGGSQPSVTPVSDLMQSSDFIRRQAPTWTHTCRQNIHPHKIKNLKKVKNKLMNK